MIILASAEGDRVQPSARVFSGTTAAFRCSPASFARVIGDCRSTALNVA